MIQIEVCQRLGDWRLGEGGRIDSKYHAQIRGEPGFWAAGNSMDEAIGDLIRCHTERFNVKIEFLGKQPR